MRPLDKPPDPQTGRRVVSPPGQQETVADPLRGKTAIVTGGASGIGTAIACRLSARGASVAIADVDPDGQRLAELIDGIFVRTDVTRRSENDAAFSAAADHFGSLDIAVLNAGIGEEGDFDTFDPEHYRQLVAVNLDGVVYGAAAALEFFTKQGSGSVLATASLAGLVESPITPLYAATKHAVVGLVRSLAPRMIDQDITVNALCPTFIDTPILRGYAQQLSAAGLAVLDPERAADVAEVALTSGQTGQAWPVLPSGVSEPWPFPPPPDITAHPSRTRTEPAS